MQVESVDDKETASTYMGREASRLIGEQWLPAVQRSPIGKDRRITVVISQDQKLPASERKCAFSERWIKTC